MIVQAKYGWCLRDKNMRKTYGIDNEIIKNLLRSLLCSNNSIIRYKLYFSKIFYLFSRTAAISRYRKSCTFSNNGRVIFRDFKLSRSFCKYYASHGYLLGLRKSSF